MTESPHRDEHPDVDDVRAAVAEGVRYAGRTVDDIPFAGFPAHPGLVEEERQRGVEWVFMQRRARAERPAA